MNLVRRPFSERQRREHHRLMHQIRRLIVLTRQEACRLFDIQGAPVAGEHPSYIASNAGSSLPEIFAGGRKGHDTEHAWTKVPIKDSM